MRRLASALAALALIAPAAAHAASPHKLTIEQRLQRIEDESEIRRILVQYGAYLDARDFAHYAALFARKGEWIGGYGHFTGPAEIQKMLEEKIGKGGPGYINLESYHLMSNPLIEIDGDKAHVVSKFMSTRKSADNKPVPGLSGRYVDDFVRENGQWKVQRRVTHGQIPWRDGNEPVTGPKP